ncbi:single-stranded DNA-binding protein [Lactobacillus johnsonii]|nr:single-stranded DNA-binding protein [Lactobacillus johnsonii]
MNDIKILGRTDTPEKRSAVAVRQNNRDEADFIRCVAFDKLAAAN